MPEELYKYQDWLDTFFNNDEEAKPRRRARITREIGEKCDNILNQLETILANSSNADEVSNIEHLLNDMIENYVAFLMKEGKKHLKLYKI